MAPAGLDFGNARPARGQNAEQQFEKWVKDEKPQRRFRLVRFGDVEPAFAVAELVEDREEEERADDVVDEEEGSEAFDASRHLDVGERLLAQEAGEEVAAADRPINQQGNRHEREQSFVRLISNVTHSCRTKVSKKYF